MSPSDNATSALYLLSEPTITSFSLTTLSALGYCLSLGYVTDIFKFDWLGLTLPDTLIFSVSNIVGFLGSISFTVIVGGYCGGKISDNEKIIAHIPAITVTIILVFLFQSDNQVSNNPISGNSKSASIITTFCLYQVVFVTCWVGVASLFCLISPFGLSALLGFLLGSILHPFRVLS